jgi:hypothetical protein
MQAKNADELMLIGAIRMHANANYNKGWDVVVEAYDDGDLLEELSENGMDLKKTIKSLQAMVSLRSDLMEEHQAEARASY